MRFLMAGILLATLCSSVSATDDCLSFSVGDSGLDLAPLPGFVEACSRDEELCTVLTRGYPPTVQTLAYFVSEEEWAQFADTKRVGFTVYFIAQTGGLMSTEEFRQFKDYVTAQNGQIPDHTKLPEYMKKHRQASLGILDETEDSITIGTVMTLEGPLGEVTFAASNAALQLPEHSLVLYVYLPYEENSDIDALVSLTRRWLNCLRTRNTTEQSN